MSGVNSSKSTKALQQASSRSILKKIEELAIVLILFKDLSKDFGEICWRSSYYFGCQQKVIIDQRAKTYPW